MEKKRYFFFFKENPKNYEKDQHTQKNTKENIQIDSVISSSKDPCKKQFSDEYLDNLENKLSQIINKRSRNRDLNQNNLEFEDLLLKFSPYKKTIETRKHPQFIVSEYSKAQKNQILDRERGKELKEFLLFLGTPSV